MYLVKSTWWMRRLYQNRIWRMNKNEKVVYLTFDDGPHETITPFVLDTLKQYNAKATFFCIGKNILKHRDVYTRILTEGHKAGNHTHNHLNGWKTKDEVYIRDVFEAKKYIDSDLFRPPYGKLTSFQEKVINQKVVMWDVLSGDFDTELSPEKCLKNVVSNSKNGSIIVFHDSDKAWERLSYALPRVLEFFKEKGFEMKTL